MRALTPKDEARFWSKVSPCPMTGCWWWMGGQSRQTGYGSFSLGRGANVGAHRIAFVLEHGPVPDGLFVLHRCDNPACVNPDHLFTGRVPVRNGHSLARRFGVTRRAIQQVVDRKTWRHVT